MQKPRTHSEAQALQMRLERNVRIAARLRFEREWKGEAGAVAKSKQGKRQLEELATDERRKRERLFDAVKSSLASFEKQSVQRLPAAETSQAIELVAPGC